LATITPNTGTRNLLVGRGFVLVILHIAEGVEKYSRPEYFFLVLPWKRADV
jgi:hypothetical protein